MSMPGDIAGMIGQGGFITIQVDADGPVRKLATWGVRIKDLSLAWEYVGYQLLRNFAFNFEAQGGTIGMGGAWKPLAASTVRDRLRKGYLGAAPILVRTSLLYYSLSGRGMPGNIFQIMPTQLTVGTNIFYAIFHQKGTGKSQRSEAYMGWKKVGGVRQQTPKMRIKTSYGMPPRPIVGISPAQSTQVVQILNSYIYQIAANAWGAS